MITRRLLVSLSGVLVVAALVVAVGSASGGTVRSGVTARAVAANFTDPVGDAGGAADITAISISDDAVTGTITLTATANGVTTIDGASEPDFHVFIDSDKNGSTGQSGSDYALEYWRSASDWGWDVLRYDGAKWGEVNSQTVSFSRSGDVLTWKLNKADLGGVTSFAFGALTTIWANNQITAADRAPDAGTWTYDLSSAPAPTPTPAPTPAPAPTVKLVIGVPTIVPAQVVAGKRLVVTFPVIRSDTGQPVTSGTMICDPSVQGKVITHAESFKNGTARLAFTIPKTAKGKALKVRVTIKNGNLAATRIATFKVR